MKCAISPNCHPKFCRSQVLDLISNYLSRLPLWLRLFVTSREDRDVMKALNKYKPKELRVDEARNRNDVKKYLVSIASKHGLGDLTMADIEKDVLRTKGIDMKGKLVGLQDAMTESLSIYREVSPAAIVNPTIRKSLELTAFQPHPYNHHSFCAEARHAREDGGLPRAS